MRPSLRISKIMINFIFSISVNANNIEHILLFIYIKKNANKKTRTKLRLNIIGGFILKRPLNSKDSKSQKHFKS